MVAAIASDRRSATASAPHRGLAGVLVSLAVVSTAVASLGAPLLPTIATADHVSLGASQWALTISLLVGAVATPLLGRMGDGLRRRATTLATVGAVTVGCILSALPLGFAALLAGRALQGVGLALVPLATACARDELPEEVSRRTIVVIGITTAAGVGLGYPLAGLLTQFVGLWAAFAVGAALSIAGLVAAAMVLPPSPERVARMDLPGTALVVVGVVSLLLAVAQGPGWGWSSAAVLGCAGVGVAAVAAWVAWELRSRAPLVDLRLLRRRSVLSGNVTGLLVALGFYPLMSLVVRYVQTPTSAGYGFGASALIAGLMLTPFSAASFAARRPALAFARRTSPDSVVAAAAAVLAAAQILFVFDRSGYLEVASCTALTGFGVGAVFAVNPIQIVDGVPVNETGSSISFYQLIRTAGYSVASALSATVLVAYTANAGRPPAGAGYGTAAIIDLIVLGCALAVAFLLAVGSRRCTPATAPLTDSRSTPGAIALTTPLRRAGRGDCPGIPSICYGTPASPMCAETGH